MENSSRNRILGNFFVIYRKTEKIRFIYRKSTLLRYNHKIGGAQENDE